jgi:hypothetical protein
MMDICSQKPFAEAQSDEHAPFCDRKSKVHLPEGRADVPQ